jgi:hypothetical protein
MHLSSYSAVFKPMNLIANIRLKSMLRILANSVVTCSSLAVYRSKDLQNTTSKSNT